MEPAPRVNPPQSTPLAAVPAGLWTGWGARLGAAGTLRRQLTVGAAGTASLQVTSLVLGLVSSILLARLMGPAGYGTYAYALALVTVMAVPTYLGLPRLIVRQMARYQVNEQWGLMRGLLIRANQAVLAISLATAAVAAGFAWMLRHVYSSEALLTFAASLALLPLLGLGAVRLAALRGLRHVLLGQMPDMLVRNAAFVLALLLAALLWGEHLTPFSAMAMQVGATALAFGIGAILLIRNIPAAAKASQPDYEMKAWLGSALPFMLIGCMQIISTKTDIVMLGFYRPAEDVGVYRVAVQIAMLVVFPLTAVNMVIAPHMARLWAQQDKATFQKMVTWSARGILLLSLPLALLFIGAGELLLSLVFGAAFAAGALPLAILAGGQLVNAGTGSVTSILSMTGHERAAAQAVAVGAAANIVLNVTLIPLWGMAGAAVATLMALVIWNVYMVIYVWCVLKLDPTILGRR
jgi:O-antigen/teichoic acid export membrane protein